jgi:hypothetical protein
MRYIYIFAVVIFFSACKVHVYRPVTVKPTNFTKKGDCEFAINAFTMAEFHGAYAITDHVAVSGTLGTGGSRDTVTTKDSFQQPVSTSINTRRIKDNELSIGYFTPVGHDGSSFEFFAGMGFAHRKTKVNFTDFKNSANNFNTESIDHRYQRLFFQPSFGRNGKFIDIAISNRFTFITYERNGNVDRRTEFISETVMTARYGYKNVKLMTQVGFTLFNVESPYAYYPFTFGFGLYIQFNENIRISPI